MTVTLAVLVPLLPFLAALAGLLLGRTAPRFVRPLAVLPTAVSALLAVAVFLRHGTGAGVDAGTRLTPTGSVPIDLALHLDGFATLTAVLVGVVASAVQIYSTGYLREDPRYPSYAALVSLFTSAMLLVVYSGDLLVLLIGWEVMGICSYFLVGHYWETEAARSASLKAFLVTKLGDVPFLFGIFALAADAGTFRINGILTAAVSGGIQHPTLVALLLLAGVAGKSAQFPLHTWLPDAMAGPTPVSALIHAATMVAAGVYLVARLLPVFTLSAAVLAVLAVMAAITMIGSALCALAQDDIKRVLAYSTIGQLGYMTAALAVADRGAAVFHLLTHGAFKALLFLGAGVVIHAAGTNSLAAMARMTDLRTRVPDAFWTMTVGLAALAALFPFSGFFSKEAVLHAAERAATGQVAGLPTGVGWTVLVSGLLTAMLTAAYATRLWLRAFGGGIAAVRLPHPATAAATTAAGAMPAQPVPPTAAVGTEPAEPTAAAGIQPAEPHEQAPAPEPAEPAHPAQSTAPAKPVQPRKQAQPVNAAQPHEPHAMRWPLWLLFLPALGLGTATGVLPDYLDGHSLSPTLVTSVLGTGLALVGVLVMYAAWRTTAARAGHTAAAALSAPAASTPTQPAPVAAAAGGSPCTANGQAATGTTPGTPGGRPAGAVTPGTALDIEAGVTEALAVGARRSVEAPDPADPGRLLLGPLHRPAAHGFHLDAAYHTLFVRPAQAAARLVAFLDREVVETYVKGSGAGTRMLGSVVRAAQTGNVQTYLSALLAGAVVLAVLVAVGA